eukprot:TRINITY_DN10550_c0_g1_i1.p1 TRINITY_DN10550_c0_g1~~TRINITY_DN10550_c0_g1_i1.p1  ORF type:complete len:853 (+),score=209.16 TRINITY_DN10550_c0_g1_i1:165-2561(+)
MEENKEEAPVEEEEEEEYEERRPVEQIDDPYDQSGKRSRIKEWNALIDEGVLLWKDGEEDEQRRLPYVGNGYLAAVINAKEMYVAGVFNGELSKGPSHRAVLPNTFNFYVPDVPVVETALDTQSGIYHKILENEDVQIRQYSYAHRVHFSIIVHEIEFLSKSSRTLRFKILESPSPSSPDIDFSLQQTLYNNTIVFAGNTKQPETSYLMPTKVTVVRTTLPAEGQSIVLSAGESRTWRFITAVRTSLDSGASDPTIAAQLDYKRALDNQNNLRSQHAAAWNDIWKAGVKITSYDPEGIKLQRITRASFYYLLSSIPEKCGKHACPISSLSPGSLATNGYNGHVFWDADTWSFPPLMLFWPTIASTMLDYRFHLKEGAAIKANKYGYRGLMYPWESAATGEDSTPESVPFGELEQHITGDVAFAYRLYWHSTYDRKWLRDQAAPLLLGIAEYFESRVVKEGNKYHIRKVVPIDEGLWRGVNNSIFMNVGVKYGLEFAIQTGKLLNYPTPQVWQDIANNIEIPFDPKQDVYLPYTGYHVDNPHPGSLDAIMIGYPYLYPMTPKQQTKALIFYSKGLVGPPGMQNCIISTSWNSIHDRGSASTLFKKCYEPVTHEPFYVWTEGENFGGCPQFLTASGGYLQALINGFGGIRIKEDGLYIEKPALPPNVAEVKFNNVCYLGNRFTIWYNDELVYIKHQGEDRQLCPGGSGGSHFQEFFIHSAITGRVHAIRSGDVKPFSGPTNNVVRIYEIHMGQSEDDHLPDQHYGFSFDPMQVFVGIFALIIFLKVCIEKPLKSWKRKVR